MKKEKRVIGGIGVTNIDKYQGVADIGYWLGEKYWRKGYGTEVASRILNFVFDRLKLRKIKIPVFVKNKASNALARKLGAKLEGTLRKHVRSKATGKIHDEYVYSLLRE